MMAITLTITGEASRKIGLVLKEAKEEFGYSYIMRNGYAPHITLVSGIEGVGGKELEEVCVEAALRTSLITLKMNCISLFCRDNPFVYIRWGATKQLLDLKNELQASLRKKLGRGYKDEIWDSEEWIAKTSLAGYDTKYNIDIIDMMLMAKSLLGKDFCVEFKSISLIDYGTGKEQLLECYSFGS